MQRNGSKVLLCFWQWGQVREDLVEGVSRLRNRVLERACVE